MDIQKLSINANHYLMQALQRDAPLVHAVHKSLEDLPIFVCIAAAVSQLG
jgi:Na+-transporting NADH:ubiquinone oxidoreductase subunit NqrE